MSDYATPADIGAIVNGRNGWGDGMGGGFWIFALIVLAFMGQGGWGFGGNRGGDVMTTAEACNMNSFNELKSQVGRMNDMMFQDQTTLSGAICNLGFQAEQQTNRLSTQLLEMKCALEKEIANQGALTRDLIQVNKMEAMAAEIAELKEDRRMANVVRYPNQFVYSTNNPFFNCNSGCCNPLF